MSFLHARIFDSDFFMQAGPKLLLSWWIPKHKLQIMTANSYSKFTTLLQSRTHCQHSPQFWPSFIEQALRMLLLVLLQILTRTMARENGTSCWNSWLFLRWSQVSLVHRTIQRSVSALQRGSQRWMRWLNGSTANLPDLRCKMGFILKSCFQNFQVLTMSQVLIYGNQL